jgi:hypothetical protein
LLETNRQKLTDPSMCPCAPDLLNGDFFTVENRQRSLIGSPLQQT